jgi:hypothetical protein
MPDFSDYQDLSSDDFNLDFDMDGTPKPQSVDRSSAFTIKLPFDEFLFDGEKSFRVKLKTGKTVSFPKSQAVFDKEKKLVLASTWIVIRKKRDGEIN